MFIVTVCLLILVAWFFFNAMNEKRWVDAHRHDDTVAGDHGLLPNFSTVTQAIGMDSGGARVSVDQEDTPTGRAVAKVKRRTAKYAEKLDQRVAAARINAEVRPASAAEENTFFGRMVGKVSHIGGHFGSMLDNRAAQGRAAAEQAKRDRSAAKDSLPPAPAITGREAAKAARMKRRFNESGTPTGLTSSVKDEDGFFNRLVGKVSGRLESIEQRVERKLEKSRVDPTAEGSPAKDDLIGRIATKRLGPRMNEADDAAIGATKNLTDKL